MLWAVVAAEEVGVAVIYGHDRWLTGLDRPWGSPLDGCRRADKDSQGYGIGGGERYSQR